jgi:hypothetical protein
LIISFVIRLFHLPIFRQMDRQTRLSYHEKMTVGSATHHKIRPQRLWIP